MIRSWIAAARAATSSSSSVASGSRVAEVVADRGVEEVRLLGHGPDHLPEGGELDPADIDVVDLDRAGVDVVEARDEVGGRGLAGA